MSDERAAGSEIPTRLTEALHPDALTGTAILTESATRITEVAGSNGNLWDVLVIQSGRSKNGRTYSGKVLEEAAPLFDGVPSYAKHRGNDETERHPNDKIGKFSNPVFGHYDVNGQMVEGIQARFKVVAPWAKALLREAFDNGEPDFVGFSIDAGGRWDRTTGVVHHLGEVHSVDLVAEPAAGGRLQRLVASAEHQPAEEQHMTPEEISALVDRQVGGKLTAIEEAIAKLVPAAAPERTAPPAPPETPTARLTEAESRALLKGRIAEAFEGVALDEVNRKYVTDLLLHMSKKGDVTDDDITETIRRQQDHVAAMAPAKAESITENIARVGNSSHDQVRIALTAWLANEKPPDGIKPLRSLQEGYCRWNGLDYFDMNPLRFQKAFQVNYEGILSHEDIQESLATASWGQIFADVLYLRLISEFGRIQEIDDWRMLVSDVVSVPDFRTYHYARVGGYADFTSVSEGATYPTLTSPGDEEQTFSVAKYGGIDDWTMEASLNDVTGKVRQLPTSMARAMSRTLYKWVLDLFTTTNPTMGYDTTALYDAGHSNTGTAALSITSMDAVTVAMRDQIPFGTSAEVMGGRNKPRFVIIPNELDSLAERVFSPSDAFLAAIASSIGTSAELDPARYRNKGITPIIYDYATDANNYFVVADPTQVPTAVVGFLNGNQSPELFLSDDPTQGSRFTADKTAAKCRLIWGGAMLDHRTVYRQVVT
jgi:hypothetical protein